MVKRFTPEYIQEMVDWFQCRTEEEGVPPTISETKIKFSMSEDSVRKYVTENGLELRKRGTVPGRTRGAYSTRKIRKCLCGQDLPHGTQSKYCSVECPSRPMRWTPPNKDVVPALLEKYKFEKHLETLASEFDLTVNQVRRHLIQEGVWEGRAKKLKSSLFERHGVRARELYEQGYSINRVASFLGITHQTINTWRSDHDWKQKQQIRSGPTGLGSMTDLRFEEVSHLLPKMWEDSKRTVRGRTRGSAYRIADTLGVGPKVVQHWLELAGISIRRPAFEDIKDDMVYFYKTHSLASTASEFNISSETASAWLRRAGVTILEDKTVSSYEKEIASIIESWGVVVESNVERLEGSKQHIDIYTPEHKVGIEFNGTYWHSETHKDRLYHQSKSKLAEEAGIRLIHIWEYDWETKRDQYLSIIRNALGLNDRKIGARKCHVREISVDAKREFLVANHFQGNDNAQIRLGLFHEDELVSVMTFGRARFVKGKPYDFELLRFCSAAGTNVQGGASKLFAHFQSIHPEASVVSYSDNGRTTGGMYRSLGFELSHESEPSYVWTNQYSDVISRYSAQVHRLKTDDLLQAKYGDALQSMSESQIMKAEKYFRIYDSGSKVWVYTPQSPTL